MKEISKICTLLVALCMFISMLSACDARDSVSKLPLDTASGNSTSAKSSAEKDTAASKKVGTATSKKDETSKPKSSSSKNEASENSSSKKKITVDLPSDIKFWKPIWSAPILGSWKGSYDVSKLFEYDNLPACPVECTITFHYDIQQLKGIYSEKINENSFRSALRTILPKAMDAEFKAQNITQAEFETEIGMTLTEYIDSYIEESISLTYYKTEWKYPEEKLYVYDEMKEDFEHVPYSLKGDDKLSLTMDGETITYTRVE